jgi:hypothetical protein
MTTRKFGLLLWVACAVAAGATSTSAATPEQAMSSAPGVLANLPEGVALVIVGTLVVAVSILLRLLDNELSSARRAEAQPSVATSTVSAVTTTPSAASQDVAA